MPQEVKNSVVRRLYDFKQNKLQAKSCLARDRLVTRQRQKRQ